LDFSLYCFFWKRKVVLIVETTSEAGTLECHEFKIVTRACKSAIDVLFVTSKDIGYLLADITDGQINKRTKEARFVGLMSNTKKH
jgi:hypothetical protein